MTCPLSMAAMRPREILDQLPGGLLHALRMTGLRKEGQATAINTARIASTMINSNSVNPPPDDAVSPSGRSVHGV